MPLILWMPWGGGCPCALGAYTLCFLVLFDPDVLFKSPLLSSTTTGTTRFSFCLFIFLTFLHWFGGGCRGIL